MQFVVPCRQEILLTKTFSAAPMELWSSMRLTHIALAACLVALAFAAAPAAASPDNVHVCAYGVKDGCPAGHVAEVHAKGHMAYVPDPCYTTQCF
jgi:hypothetical protein